MKTIQFRVLSAVASLSLSAPLHAVPAVVKLHDFDNTDILNNPGPQAPNDAPVLIGSKLWFTTEKGGYWGFGTLSTFDVGTFQLEEKLSMDNASGNTPKASPVIDGDQLLFTTQRGGTGDRGTLLSWDTAGDTHEVLWNSPDRDSLDPNQMWGDVTVIDRGEGLGKDIYFMAYFGGTPGFGGILRYQTNDQSVTTVHEFQGAPGDGRNPYKGFTAVGTDLYFTTFTGGLVATGQTIGGGILGKLDASTRGNESVTTLATLPGGDGSLRFPAHNPYYRAKDHSLYFTSIGTTSTTLGTV